MQSSGSDLAKAIHLLSAFSGSDLGTRIADLEWRSCGCDKASCQQMLIDDDVTAELLAAACEIKRSVGQINVVIHMLGVLLIVPRILAPGERIEYVSLGAGNTGRAFDLETDRRIAEFKFINWRGGAEAIRQNSLFKDFYLLAEAESAKQKELYVIDPKFPLQFLRGGRAISSVLSRNVKLKAEFDHKYGDRFGRVVEYYRFREHDVRLIDAAAIVPELVYVAAEAEESQTGAA